MSKRHFEIPGIAGCNEYVALLAHKCTATARIGNSRDILYLSIQRAKELRDNETEIPADSFDLASANHIRPLAEMLTAALAAHDAKFGIKPNVVTLDTAAADRDFYLGILNKCLPLLPASTAEEVVYSAIPGRIEESLKKAQSDTKFQTQRAEQWKGLCKSAEESITKLQKEVADLQSRLEAAQEIIARTVA